VSIESFVESAKIQYFMERWLYHINPCYVYFDYVSGNVNEYIYLMHVFRKCRKWQIIAFLTNLKVKDTIDNSNNVKSDCNCKFTIIN
jgi:hypothetical protein